MRKYFSAIIGLLLGGLQFWGNATIVSTMRTDHLESPIGIDNPRPRLGWQLHSKENGTTQRSYRVIVSTDSLDFESGCVWDSGVVDSGDVMARYEGAHLEPFTRYWWKVCIEDNKNNLICSPVSSFETGMMDIANWHGYWISDNNDREFKAAPRFRKTFSLGKEVASARAYIAVAGLYTLHINGVQMRSRELDPAFTRYDKRVLYSSYDITGLLQQGGNAVGVELGNGWYNHQAMTVWDFHKAPWRNRPCFCMDIRICYTDGTQEVVSTGYDWRTSSEGPCTYNNIYVGEHHDLRRSQNGWSTCDFDPNMWDGVRVCSCPTSQIVSQTMVPIRHTSEIRATSITQLKSTRWLLDFGTNQAGNAHLKIKGPKGTKITLKYSERRRSDNRADQSNIDIYYRDDATTYPYQTDIVVLSGGDDDFIPMYSYKGFRYIEVNSNAPLELTADNITAMCINSDVASAGSISSSDPVINKINNATRRSYLSNLMGYPTDCPQREKNGWTGDGHIGIQTGLYNFDVFTVYEKWMADHLDEQLPNGVLPDIIPTSGWGYWSTSADGNGLDWTSTIAIIPWNLYLFTSDIKPLNDCYDSIKRYVDYALGLTTDGLVCWGRGDWVPVTKRSDKTLVCSCFLYKDLCILSDAARLLGKNEDADKYRAQADKVRDAINARFLDKSSGIYADGMQTDLSLPLYFGVTPEDVAGKTAAALAAKVASDGYHINAGVHGAKAVLHALSDYGYADTAYKMATAKDFPGWGWWVENGHSTLVENWHLDSPRDNSDNHIMFGDISAWFYKALGGIQPDADQPGFRHIILKPSFPKGLDSFECSHESPYGTIRTSWAKKGRKIEFCATIPCNCTASVHFPGGRTEELESGTYRLTVK